MDQISDFNPYRPKVSLRRFTDPKIRLAIKEYILNRKTLAAGVSLAFVLSLTGCASQQDEWRGISQTIQKAHP